MGLQEYTCRGLTTPKAGWPEGGARFKGAKTTNSAWVFKPKA